MPREKVLRELSAFRPSSSPRKVERTALKSLPFSSLLDKLDRAIKDEEEAAPFYRSLARELKSLGFFAESGEVGFIAEAETGHASRLGVIRRKVRAASGSR
jgi:rubrerythrin